MVSKKHPEGQLYPTFCFTEESRTLRLIKAILLGGGSVVIEPVDADRATGYLVRVYDGMQWSTEEIIRMSDNEEDGGLGKNELHGLAVHMLGSKTHESRLIEATLSAGFPVYLIADHRAGGQVVGYYILRASISDNS